MRAEARLFLERARKRIHERARREFAETQGRAPRTVDELRDPRLLSPLVMDEVLGCVAYLPGGGLEYPLLAQLEAERQLRALRTWCQLFYRDQGRWPDSSSSRWALRTSCS